ncbi:phosphodiester glycosidase family protein, partial [Roseisolibacter sp. H3M3-2]|uniref:phosphodiester glycosidase family protein n=1 Tax=Roseisolibacter sp. H3M3-2 TaxID=3031323 RepID=UPI0023DCC1B8
PLLGDGGPATLAAVLRLAPDRVPLRTAMGGWGRLLAAGEDVSARADALEGTFPRFSAARHPRSAVGVSRDGRTVWLVAVDGRSTASVGMTFGELAPALRALGAWDAMNLDGGGSTTLVLDGRVANAPSDPSGERPVGNALVVTVPDASARACPAPVPTRATSWDVRDADRTPRKAP